MELIGVNKIAAQVNFNYEIGSKLAKASKLQKCCDQIIIK
jgi:hypothetical protein